MFRRILAAVAGTFFGAFLVACGPGQPAAAVSGIVRDEVGPVAGGVAPFRNE